MKNISTITMHPFSIAIATGCLAISMFAHSEVPDALNLKFAKALSDAGGSVLEPLVHKCNNLRDSDIPKQTHSVKTGIMVKIAGSIGPIKYRQEVKTKTRWSRGKIGELDGITQYGTPVTVDVIGTRTWTESKTLPYKAEAPKGFKEALAALQSLSRNKHPRASAEVGACIFVEATKGQIGMNERKMRNYFKQAAEGGDEDGMFMYAFCLYHGIGGRVDLPKAYTAIEQLVDSMKNKSPNKSAIRGEGNSGWIGRRICEFGLR